MGRGRLGIDELVSKNVRLTCDQKLVKASLIYRMEPKQNRICGVLDFGGDRRRGRGSLGVNLRRPTVTKGTMLNSCLKF